MLSRASGLRFRFRVLGFRVLGFRGLGFCGCGLRVYRAEGLCENFRISQGQGLQGYIRVEELYKEYKVVVYGL